MLLLLALCAALLAPAAQGAERFSDVPAGSWYAETVSAMADRGWLSGYPDGTFQPGRTISAAEFVSVAVQCAGLTPKGDAAGHWAAGSLQAALEAGWYDWDEIPPTGEKHDQPISRQLAVKILMRALLPEVRGTYQEQAGKIRDLSELNGRYYDGVFAAYAAGVTAAMLSVPGVINVTGLTINGGAGDLELREDGLLQQVPVLGEVNVNA